LLPGADPFLKPWMIDLSDNHYTFDISRARTLLGWEPRHDFSILLAETIDWYAANESWWRAIKSGEFAEWYQKNYAKRGLHVG